MNKDDIKRLIEQKVASDLKLRLLTKRIESGNATFKDTSEYSRIYSEIVGNTLSEFIIDLEERETIASELLRNGYDNINNILARVQTDIDKKRNLNLRPQKAQFPQERVDTFSHSLEDRTVPDETIQRRANNGTANITMSFHDDYMKENAKFRSRAGLRCYIDRQTNGKCCQWCSDVAGRYEYGSEPSDIYRRHDNCDCTVIFENGRQRQDVWSKRTWTADREKIKYTKPMVISRAEAQRMNDENVGNNRQIVHNSSLDNSGENGIIKLENNYTTAGLMFISHRDDLYRFAEKVIPLKDHEDIVVHADRESFLILDSEKQEIISRLSPKALADLLRNSSNYKGGAIRLLSCQSGYGGDNSLAKKLADELDVEVIAPTEILAISNTGDMFISDNKLLIDMWEAGEHVKETGKWEVFKPKKEKW